MYVTTPQVTVKNEYHTKVGNGGYAAIGPHSALHVGQSAVTPTGLVYDLIVGHCDVNLNVCFARFSLEIQKCGSGVGGKLRIFDLRCQWWFEMS